MCLRVALFYFACVGTRLSWVLGDATATVEKQMCPSAVYSKSDQVAYPLCEEALAPVLGGVEEGEVLGAELISRFLYSSSPI